MAKSAEELGLYDGLPPDATVDGTSEDPGNPGWSEVRFSDGRIATMPTEAVAELPQTAPAGPPEYYGPPAAAGVDNGQYGPPAPVVPPEPGAPPLTPGELAQTGSTPAVPFMGMGAAGASPLGGLAGQAAAPAALELAGGESALPPPRVDPMAAVVSPGSAGGFAPYSEAATSGVTETERAEDPAAAAARTASAYDAAANANLTLDTMRHRAAAAGLDEQRAAYEEQETQTRQAMRQAQLEKEGHARALSAIEKTPIDEDGFWTSSPGRSAGAWVALALSGFLQGATKGQNPALAQMVASLDRDQDRWLDNQRRSREGQYRTRERLMGDASATEASYRMQLAGIVSKRIDADAARAGLAPPPGLETYRGSLGVKAAEAQTAIGQTITRQATEQVQREARATPATGPVRAGDVELRRLGVAPKAHAEAMDPKGLNLGGVVGGASRLRTVSDALEKIAAKHGGSLPSQETVSWSSLGLGAQAARLGLDRGKDEVSVKQLLEEAKLAYKQTVNIKSIDSENEGKNFNAIMDSGEGSTTLDAIRTRAEIANQTAVSIANGVTQDTQGYIDFVLGRQQTNQGVEHGRAPKGFQPMAGGVRPATAADGTEAPAPSPPLADAGATAASRPVAPALVTSATGSRPGTYQRLRGSKLSVPR